MAGTLSLTRDGSSTGNFQTGTGATLNFAGSSTHTLNGGAFSGTGTIQGMGATLLVTGAVSAQNFNLVNGTLKLAVSATLTLTGNYVQGANATLLIDSIKGTTPGVDFGQLLVTGSVSLQGTFTVTVATGYTPPTGATYKVMTFGSRLNDFGTKNVPVAVSFNHNPTDLTLRSTRTGSDIGGLGGSGPDGTGWGGGVGSVRANQAVSLTLLSLNLGERAPEPDVSSDALDGVFAQTPADSVGDPFTDALDGPLASC